MAETSPTGAGAIVVVPTFNEAENLPRIVPAILEALPDARVLVAVAARTLSPAGPAVAHQQVVSACAL